VILGKTNLTELAGFRGGADGLSGRAGRRATRIIWALVGVVPARARLPQSLPASPLAVGSETNGSIVVPAAFNGVVGFKPSVGLLSRSGIIPASHRQDTPGPMARSVFDTALLLNAMSGVDPQDAASMDAPQGIDYTALLKPGALQDKRIGYPATFCANGETLSVDNSAISPDAGGCFARKAQCWCR
jgi:amidase